MPNPHEAKRRLEKVIALIAFLDSGPITADQVRQFESHHWELADAGAQLKHPSGNETRAEVIRIMSTRPKPRRKK